MSDTLTLTIDASTNPGTVAVIDRDRIVAVAEVAMRGEREERLMPAVAAALGAAGAGPRDLTRVVAGGGPGSFTSLRIGVAIAKGICVAGGLPLLAAPSLALLVAGTAVPLPAASYLAVLDAMRGDVYAAVIDFDGAIVTAVREQQLVPRAAVAALAARHAARTVGAAEDVDAAPHARGVLKLAPHLVREVSLDSWEPAYGRLAEAQVKWEAEHGRSLATG
jgi:tRNA threonylcarbamoyladenosine biosynthesis protein TsaB